jgi:hypothetical protein
MRPASHIVVRLSIPDGPAQIDVVLVGEHTGSTAGSTAEDGPAQDAAAGHRTRGGTDTGTDAGPAEAAVELAFTAGC